STNVRARPGVPASAINAEYARFVGEFAKRLPNWYPPQYEFRVQPLNRFVLGGFLETVGVLCTGAGGLLLIACGNVSILLLARAGSRAKEIGVRIAMGAPRNRLFRQLLTEAMMLSLLGAAAGVGLAAAGIPALIAILPPGTLPNGLPVHLNGWVL